MVGGWEDGGCVIVALHKLLPEKPDLVISGINFWREQGGEKGITTGTVARREKRRASYRPAVAISLCSKGARRNFADSARVDSGRRQRCILKEGRRQVL